MTGGDRCILLAIQKIDMGVGGIVYLVQYQGR